MTIVSTKLLIIGTMPRKKKQRISIEEIKKELQKLSFTQIK